MSDADDTHRVCPRCGALSDGSAWCEECGLNLRASGQPPGLSSQPPPPPLAAKPSRSTSQWLALLVATVLIALAAFAAVVLFLKRGGDGREDLPVAQTTIPAPLTTSNDFSPTEPASTTSVPVDTNIPLEAVENLLIEYESAYSNEDLAGLRNLFTDNLVRLPGTGATQDLHAALATYREQFGQLAVPIYVLSGVRASSNASQAEAFGKYTITDGGRAAGSGRIAFHIVLLGNSLYIDRLEVTPSG